MGLLAGKRILFGVGGGIAAYKAPELVRRLRDAGADVHVIVSDAGARFVSELALEVVSEHPVGRSLWAPDRDSRIVHTDLGKSADLILVAPCTANLVARLRLGFADDLLSTTILACKTPVLLCPAMNTEMLDNPIVRAHLADLAAMPRITLLEPGVGLLACGIVGPGRQPDPPDIIEAAASTLTPKDLAGMRVTLTAGPTHEPIDPVRYLANHSTGTMGFELARAFAAHGASVTLVAGPVTRRTPVGIAARVDVVTAAQMDAAVDSLWTATDVLVMTAAVADFRPRDPSAHKMKKRANTDEAPTLPLARTDDILLGAARHADRARVALVGFAAETDDVLAYAQAKRAEKDLDWIVANDVSGPEIGFGTGDNAGWLVARDGVPIALARAPKAAFADAIVARIAPALRARASARSST